MRSRKITTPRGSTTRPTAERVRQRVFDLLGPEIEGARVLDLFAGSGAVGIEALSRGATSATLVESDRGAIACIRTNLTTLNLNATLITQDVLRALPRLSGPFDLIYIDPPYALNKSRKNSWLYNEALLLEIDRLNLLSGMLILEEEKFTLSSPNELPLQNMTFRETRAIGDVRLHIFQS